MPMMGCDLLCVASDGAGYVRVEYKYCELCGVRFMRVAAPVSGGRQHCDACVRKSLERRAKERAGKEPREVRVMRNRA